MITKVQIEAVHAYDVLVMGHAYQVDNEALVADLKRLALVGLALQEMSAEERGLLLSCAHSQNLHPGTTAYYSPNATMSGRTKLAAALKLLEAP